LDKIAESSLLYDFYGQLLTRRQREVMRLYHEENYSLSEIADEFSVSRQSVHDTLKNAENALKGYEEKMGLLSRMEAEQKAVGKIKKQIERILEENRGNDRLAEGLKEIETILRSLG